MRVEIQRKNTIEMDFREVITSIVEFRREMLLTVEFQRGILTIVEFRGGDTIDSGIPRVKFNLLNFLWFYPYMEFHRGSEFYSRNS